MIKEKKFFSHLLVITALFCMLWLFSAGHHDTAQVYAGDNIRETDVTSASAGNEIVLVEGSFVYLPKDEILNRINEIRLEACRTGVRDPRDESRNLTEADYVPIRWSSDLEWIAQTRAAEATIYMDHERPNGGQWFEVSHNGVSTEMEVLAWNFSADILGGIDQWYEEKSVWENGTQGTTGHYTAIINPDNQYVGIGAFNSDYGLFGTVAGEFTTSGNLDESQTGARGAYKQKVEVQKSGITIDVCKEYYVHIGKSGPLAGNIAILYEDGCLGAWPSSGSLSGITFTSDDTNVVTVASDGTITGKNVGTANVNTSYNGVTYKTSVTVDDHEYETETVDIEPSCTEDGSGTRICSICGEKVTGVIPATGHKWNKEYTVDTPATQDAEGRESIHCSVCDAVKEGSERPIPIIEKHEIKSVSKAATCQETGMKKHYECTICHKMYKDTAGSRELTAKEIKKLTTKKKGHSFKEKSGEYLKSEATCTKPAVYYYTCKMCHTKGSKTYKSGKALGHDFVPGSITKATAKKDGKIASKCSRCGKTNKGIKIPKASKIVVLDRKSIVYAGGGVEKDAINVVVKGSKYPLREDEYTVTKNDPTYNYKKKKGSGTIIVTFKPECRYYSGSMTLTYKITKVPKAAD